MAPGRPHLPVAQLHPSLLRGWGNGIHPSPRTLAGAGKCSPPPPPLVSNPGTMPHLLGAAELAGAGGGGGGRVRVGAAAAAARYALFAPLKRHHANDSSSRMKGVSRLAPTASNWINSGHQLKARPCIVGGPIRGEPVRGQETVRYLSCCCCCLLFFSH